MQKEQQENVLQASAFHNLAVWQKAMELAKQSYKVAGQLPKEEQFSLANQIRRCAVSIPSNIAEGSKRGKKEFSQFVRIAAGSAAELETQLILARELHETDVAAVLPALNEVQRMLTGLGKKL